METLVVVGIGADGWAGLDETRRNLVVSAEVVLGGERHLAMLPDDLAADRVPWPSPLREGLPGLLAEHEGRRVVALASGDPLVSGIGTTLVELLGADRVRIEPAVSSVALARARLGWSADTVEVVRDHRTLPRHLAPGRRLIVLSADGATPATVAALLTENGYGATMMTVLTDLGSEAESRYEGVATSWGDRAAGALNVVALACASSGAGARPWSPGLPDEAFGHDGQITKRDVRASALARLAPTPAALLWDVGAGAGSVAVEWMRVHPTCRGVAIEARTDRAERIARNANTLGVPDLVVVAGTAPDALDGLDAPDAVFVGGGATTPGVLDTCWSALPPGGRLVVHGVTLETERLLAERYAELGGELVRLQVEHAEPIGSFTGWTPARAVTQWSVTKDER